MSLINYLDHCITAEGQRKVKTYIEMMTERLEEPLSQVIIRNHK